MMFDNYYTVKCPSCDDEEDYIQFGEPLLLSGMRFHCNFCGAVFVLNFEVEGYED